MNKAKRKLTLSQPATYQIKVPGRFDESWSDWTGEMTITIGTDDNGHSVSTLVGDFDQAALQGVLRRIYSLGLPLISVIWVEAK